jgi:ACS family hexuronate transporter-like MFS transporter
VSPWRRRVLLTLLILGTMLNYADRQIIAILKPLIGSDFGWTDADYGGLASAFQLASAIGLLFAGWFVDRVGVRRANPLAVGAWSAIGMAQGLAQTFGSFAPLRVAMGAAEAMNTPVTVKSIALLFRPEERSLAFGGMNAASTAGAIVTPLLVPPLAVAFGWRVAFLIVGGAGLVWVALWFASARPSVDFGEGAPQQPAPARSVWREVLTDRRSWLVAGAKALSDQVWWFLLYWAPDLLHRFYQLDLAHIATPLALMYGCAALGSMLGGLGSRQLMVMGVAVGRARRIALSTCAVLALPVALVPVLHSEWITVSLLGLTLAAHQGFSVNLFSLITDIVPAPRLATVTGLGAFSGNLGGIGILAFTGWILSRQGDYGPVFAFAAVSYLLAVLWIHLLQ